MDPLSFGTAEIFIRLSISLLLGSLLGIERLLAGKTAGMRTYALVSMGSAVFILITLMVAKQFVTFDAFNNFDPLRMASQIIVGIGFLGAGLIVFKDAKIRGLTTAAGLWVSSGIGMSVGFGFFELAIMTTGLTLFVFTILGYVKEKIEHLPYFKFLRAGEDPDEGEVI
jgi:putative Mg2+ transporter-C (MgtC) family protein